MAKISPRLAASIPTLVLGSLLTLPSTARELEIRGQLVTGRAKPLAGAEVVLLPHLSPAKLARLGPGGQPQPVAHTLSEEDGSFRLLAPAAGFWEVVARAPGRLEMMAALLPLLADHELPRTELPEGQLVTIALRDAAGQPAPGVTIVAAGSAEPGPGWRPAPRFATTDAEGFAHLSALRSEQLAAAARTPTHLAWGTLDPRSRRLDLALAHELLPTRLIDFAGRPIVGAVVTLDRPSLLLGASDGRGELLLPGETGALPLRLERSFLAEPLPASEPSADGSRVARLPALRRVTLETLDAQTGAPVAAAWVRHGQSQGFTDLEGRLVLSLPETSTARLEIVAEHYLGQTLEISPLEPEPKLTVPLTGVVELSGRVSDPGGKPVENVQLQVEPGAKAGTRSDAQGRFRIPRLEAGLALRLSARRAGFAPFSLEIPAPPPGPLPPLEIVLEPGVTAIGRVLDTSDRPLARAEVILIAETGSRDLALGPQAPLQWQAKTDADGRFELVDLPPGPCLLVARAAGFADLTVPGLELARSKPPIDLGELLLERGLALEGEVTHPRGTLVEGARVVARRTDLKARPIRVEGFAGEVSATTDAYGRFRIAGVPSGAVLELEAQKSPYRPRKLEGVRPDLEPWVSLAFELEGSVVGKVVDSRGQEIGGAEVFLEQPSEGSDVKTEITNARGDFTFESLPSGEVRISARAPAGVAAAQRVVLRGQGVPEEILLELVPPLAISGRVVEEISGRPIDGVVVVARPLRDEDGEGTQIPVPVETWTELGGRFALGGLTVGSYQLVFESRFYTEKAKEVRLQGSSLQGLEVALSPRQSREVRRISGQVVDSAGQPVGGAAVRLLEAASGDELRRVRSGSDGSFEVRARRGSFQLSAHHEGHASAKSEPIDVGDNDVGGILLTLSRGGVIEGRVLNVPLAELGAVAVTAQSSDDRSRHRGEVLWDGTYRIENLPAGEWQVMATTPTRRHAHPEKQVLLGEGHVLQVDLPLGEGARWRGEVRHEGKLVGGARIDVKCPELGLSFTLTSREDGSFVIDDLPHFGCRLRLGYGGPHQHLELLLDGGRLVRLVGGQATGEGASGFEVLLSPWR